MPDPAAYNYGRQNGYSNPTGSSLQVRTWHRRLSTAATVSRQCYAACPGGLTQSGRQRAIQTQLAPCSPLPANWHARRSGVQLVALHRAAGRMCTLASKLLGATVQPFLASNATRSRRLQHCAPPAALPALASLARADGEPLSRCGCTMPRRHTRSPTNTHLATGRHQSGKHAALLPWLPPTPW